MVNSVDESIFFTHQSYRSRSGKIEEFLGSVLVQREMETGRSLLASIAISRAQFGRHRLMWSRASLAAQPATGFKRKSA
jgi:hypothetical protein